MPLYHQIIMLVPRASPTALAQLFKSYSLKIYSAGGINRAIENHGVRSLPERTRTKFPMADGSRNFWEARYVSSYFDASPKALPEIDRILKLNESVIRFHTIKVPTSIDRYNSRRYNNPYLHSTKDVTKV